MSTEAWGDDVQREPVHPDAESTNPRAEGAAQERSASLQELQSQRVEELKNLGKKLGSFAKKWGRRGGIGLAHVIAGGINTPIAIARGGKVAFKATVAEGKKTFEVNKERGDVLGEVAKKIGPETVRLTREAYDAAKDRITNFAAAMQESVTRYLELKKFEREDARNKSRVAKAEAFIQALDVQIAGLQDVRERAEKERERAVLGKPVEDAKAKITLKEQIAEFRMEEEATETASEPLPKAA